MRGASREFRIEGNRTMVENETIARERTQDEGHKGGEELPRHQQYTIKVGNEVLEFEQLILSDPVPTGRQIIDAAGFRPAEEFLVFEVSRDRRLTELKLDQTTELRGSGEEQFIVFKSDRSWRGIIDGKRFEWGASDILGYVLKWLAGVDLETHGVWLERKEEPDLLIANEDKANLDGHTVERFRTEKLFKICIEGEDFAWDSKTITTEQIAQLGGWKPSLGVIEVDEHQNERTLEPGEVIRLRPGVAYGKKLCFKRGGHE